MNAVHFRTEGMHCDACPPVIETALASIPGVKAARAYPALRLTSVLFDPRMTDTATIERRINRIGFPATVIGGGESEVSIRSGNGAA